LRALRNGQPAKPSARRSKSADSPRRLNQSKKQRPAHLSPSDTSKPRSIERAIGIAALFGCGVEAVSDPVQQDPGDVLRHDLDWRKLPIVVALYRDVEALISGAVPMVDEVERLFDERVDVGRLPIAAHGANAPAWISRCRRSAGLLKSGEFFLTRWYLPAIES
jgi:hypothetical protein